MEKEIQKPNFWQDSKKATEISQELFGLKKEIEKTDELKKAMKEVKEIMRLAKEDERLEIEIEEKFRILAAELKKQEFKVFMSGQYDRKDALLSILSGAGGQDAQDWAAILLRMYQRYCEQKGFKTKILHQAFGEPSPEGRIGIKSATIEIRGAYGYGFLKKESGVHRLVRISPFSAQALRHTSFALVEVLPEIDEKGDTGIEIRPEDIKIDTFRASGPGGQYVNRRESAVRITHLSTNIVVSCQGERLQGLNKAKAMKMLTAKLYQLREKEKEKEVQKIKGKPVSAEWGNQIRSYVLHPYKMVKDLRTGVEISNVEKVLDGGLEEFIEAEIKHI